MVQTKIWVRGVAAFCFVIGATVTAQAAEKDWKSEQIADALSAGPPAVTNDARVYAWDAKGQMVLLRHGTGAYTCVASGNTSKRVGKPMSALPPKADVGNLRKFQSVTIQESQAESLRQPWAGVRFRPKPMGEEGAFGEGGGYSFEFDSVSNSVDVRPMADPLYSPHPRNLVVALFGC